MLLAVGLSLALGTTSTYNQWNGIATLMPVTISNITPTLSWLLAPKVSVERIPTLSSGSLGDIYGYNHASTLIKLTLPTLTNS